MNIYNAIMKAADHIELNPDTFRFMKTHVPHSCGTPACALGWIGFFASVEAGTLVGQMSEKVLDVEHSEFYDRMREINWARCGNPFWRNTPRDVAENLRLYAKKYHSGECEQNDDAFKRFLATALTQAPETCSATERGAV